MQATKWPETSAFLNHQPIDKAFQSKDEASQEKEGAGKGKGAMELRQIQRLKVILLGACDLLVNQTHHI